jgi:glyoxylase-like metal-dependent hydrolase (beta-lactamase superfamily II)
MANAKNTFKVKLLGTKGYDGDGVSNHGDCIIIYNEQKKQMIVYDCGSEQHAEKSIEFMEDNGITQADVILSHNDRDHFNGIQKLIDEDKVDRIFTTLLLKYVDEILDILDDKRRTREATKEHILELYDNIAKLSGNNLKDIYEDKDELPEGISFIGPDKETMFEAVAKAIEENDIQTPDGEETVVNATSLQIAISIQDGRKLLLLGDAAVENVTCDVPDYWYVQLPHHGKLASAEAIFDRINDDDIANHTFLVSDNTGNTNGGSDDLMASSVSKGKEIKNTQNGDAEIGISSYATTKSARKDYGICCGI